MALTAADARHLLRRAGFGGTPVEVAHFANREIDAVVDEIVDFSLKTPSRPAVIGNDEEWIQHYETVEWWLNRMTKASWTETSRPNPLQEKMALFWHGHFCSAQEKVYDMAAMWEQNQLFRTQGLGDFESLLQAVAVGGAMLRYLDNEVNVVGAEQENFAREVMELFTIGLGKFTHHDVIAMAKAWTGHNNVGWVEAEERYNSDYVFFPDRHDNSQKTLFAITKNWDGPAALTELCRGVRQQDTADFIAAKAWKFFAGPDPTPQIQSELAAAFVNANMSIRELMRALFKHPEFWSDTVRNGLVKSPSEFVVSLFKQLPLPISDTGVHWYLGNMGQSLFDPPNVGGWGRNGYWLSTATMWARADFISGNRWGLVGDGFLSHLEYEASAAGTDELLELFGITNATSETRDRIIAWFNQAKANHAWSVPTSGILITALLPDFQVV